MPAIPDEFRKILVVNDPIEEIKTSLSEISFSELTERNKLIWIISLSDNEIKDNDEYLNSFDNKKYKLVVEDLRKSNIDSSYKPDDDLLDLFKEDRFLYHLLSKRFDFNESQLITNALSKKMFLKIIVIRLVPILTIVLGSLLVLRTSWSLLVSRKN